MVGEALNQCIDLTTKRKQLLQSLTEAKIPPQIDEKIRKSIKEVVFNKAATLDELAKHRKFLQKKAVRGLKTGGQFV